MFYSTKDPDVVYFLGIIDYFQIYDYKKIFERFLKRLMKCNPSLDTSSQPPKIYSVRFNTFITKITQDDIADDLLQDNKQKGAVEEEDEEGEEEETEQK